MLEPESIYESVCLAAAMTDTYAMAIMGNAIMNKGTS
jgi:hypothetical protein